MSGPAPRTATDAARDASIAAGPRLVLWDLVGSCNLRCPSCPAGSMTGTNPKGLIDDDLFRRILDKLHDEVPGGQLHFYNWTEPLIHPRIDAFCRRGADLGFHVHLSSNLNVLRRPEALLEAGVKTIRISLSGFTQAIYARGHRGGRIDRVKENMRRLAAARECTGSATRIHVYYHRYRHNLHEERLMERFATELGFDFVSTWAFYLPLENVLRYVEGELPDADRSFADESILPPVDEAIAIMQPHRDRACELIDQLVLDHLGNVILCCAVYDHAATTIGSYLELDWAALQAHKYRHRTCRRCTRHGAHILFTHFDKPELREAMEQAADRALAAGTAGPRSPIALPVLTGE